MGGSLPPGEGGGGEEGTFDESEADEGRQGVPVIGEEEDDAGAQEQGAGGEQQAREELLPLSVGGEGAGETEGAFEMVRGQVAALGPLKELGAGGHGLSLLRAILSLTA